MNENNLNGKINIEDDAQNSFDGGYMSEEELKEKMAERQERYCEQKRVVVTENKKPVSKWTAIAVIIFVFLYFMALIVLNTIGIITSLLMFVFSLPLLLVAGIIYLISERKNLKR